MTKPERLFGPRSGATTSTLLKEFEEVDNHDTRLPSWADVRADIDMVYRLFELQKIVRFLGQRYWEAETNRVMRDPELLDLENVAAHTFHVARCTTMLAPYFPWIDVARVTEMALIHDEPEMLIGDKDPVGADGQGNTTHAFNDIERRQKQKEERMALDALASSMRPSIRERYRLLMEDLLADDSAEARFVKAVDKLQALAFVRQVKRGSITPDHAAFTIRYSRRGLSRFPYLQRHFICILEDLLQDVLSEHPAESVDFCTATLARLRISERP